MLAMGMGVRSAGNKLSLRAGIIPEGEDWGWEITLGFLTSTPNPHIRACPASPVLRASESWDAQNVPICPGPGPRRWVGRLGLLSPAGLPVFLSAGLAGDGSAQQVTHRGRLPRTDRFGGTSRCGSLTVRDVSFGGAWPGSRIRYDEGGHSRRFRLGRLGRVQPRRDDDRGDGPFGDGRQYPGPGFCPVDVVPVRREGYLDDRVPVVLGRDYEVGFEEVGAAVPADKSVPDGLVYGAVQQGIGQAVLIQGNVGACEAQNEPRSGQGLGANGPFVLPAF